MGACPSTAHEAANLISRGQHRLPADSNSEVELQGVAAGTASHKEPKGCCYSIGYGSMNKPCCLQAKRVGDSSMCVAAARLGGASGYKDGDCPASASEAAKLL